VAHLAAWLMVALSVSFLLRDRPIHCACLALAVWTFIPSVAAGHVVGAVSGPLAAHPATWLILAQAGVCLLLRPRPMTKALSRYLYVWLVGVVFIVAAVVTSQLMQSHGLVLLLDQVVGPLVLFWIIVSYGREQEGSVYLLRGTIIGLAVVESVLALVQKSQHSILVYGGDYANLYWFDPLRFQRWMGTTDSPLVLATLICVAAPLAVGLRNTLLRMSSMLIMLLGAITSQSRVGVAVMCVMLVYLLARGRMGVFTRLVAVTLLFFAARAILSSTLVSGISSRLSNDTGSSRARGLAWGVFGDLLHSLILTGNGLTSNYRIASEAGLQTSLESSFLMYTVDLGLLLTVAWFGVQVVIAIVHGTRRPPVGMLPAVVIALAVPQTFSALAFSNLVGVLMWSALGLLVIATQQGHYTTAHQSPAARRFAMSSRV
jgi:hypothetical protein